MSIVWTAVLPFSFIWDMICLRHIERWIQSCVMAIPVVISHVILGAGSGCAETGVIGELSQQKG